MLTLGIETSCDETSISVTKGTHVLSNAVTSSVHLHKKYGGIVPEIASRYHVEYITHVLKEALKKSGKKLSDIRLISVTNTPGLVGALLIGISTAKALSLSLGVPLIGVNHILAHLYSAFLDNNKDRPSFPFIGLVVSGGHTALFYCKSIGRQYVIGQTQDDAVGEAYDKVAKILGLGYPGGPVIDRIAKTARQTEGGQARQKEAGQARQKEAGQARQTEGGQAIKFPRSYLGKDSLDFSFSGLKTAVLYYVRDRHLRDRHCEEAEGRRSNLSKQRIAEICCAFQEAALDVIVDKAILAASMKRAKSIVVGGGVAANSRLREKLTELAKEHDIKVYFPYKQYCADNGAMIGALGEVLYKLGRRSNLYLGAEPNLRMN